MPQTVSRSLLERIRSHLSVGLYSATPVGSEPLGEDAQVVGGERGEQGLADGRAVGAVHLQQQLEAPCGAGGDDNTGATNNRNSISSKARFGKANSSGANFGCMRAKKKLRQTVLWVQQMFSNQKRYDGEGQTRNQK